MTIKNCLRFTLPFVALFAFASIASAQATATLTMAANVQDSMQLKISTHAGPVGATVTTVTEDTAANAFSVNFGDVNGLGLGTPTSGVSVVASAGGALYTTPIYVTPIFSGFGTDVASITVKSGGGTNNALAGEGSSAINTAVLTTTAGAAVITGADSDSLNTRFVSFAIARTLSPVVLTASFIYEMTVDAP